jgi:hypothetical protein
MPKKTWSVLASEVLLATTSTTCSEKERLEANWTQLLLQLKTIEETNDKDRKANVVLGLAVSLLAGCARD